MSESVEVNIRQAQGSDVHSLMESYAQMRTESKWVEMDEEAFNQPLEQLAEQLDMLAYSSSNLLLLATAGDEIIGLLTIREVHSNEATTKRAELGIVIKKEYWGLGLGTSLIDESLYWAHEFSDLHTLYLDVYKENKAAIHLYQKMGFSETKKVDSERIQMDYRL